MFRVGNVKILNALTKARMEEEKRFSARSVMMNKGKTKENEIDKTTSKKFRKDIVQFSPVIKWFNEKKIFQVILLHFL